MRERHLQRTSQTHRKLAWLQRYTLHKLSRTWSIQLLLYFRRLSRQVRNSKLDLDPLMVFTQMVRTNNQDELELFRYRRFFRWVLLREWGNLICRQREGTFRPRSIQLRICCPCRDRSGERWVCSLKFPSSRALMSWRTMFLWALSICDSIRRTCCLSVRFSFLLIRSS